MVPRDWNACTLDKIFQLGSGDTKPADLSGERTPNTPYPVYGGNDVMGYSSLYNSTSEVVVIGRVGEKCGVTRLVSETCWITDNALYTKFFTSETNKTFLTYRLQHQDLSRLRNKGSQPLVSQKPIYALEIAFPPIAEQTKIAQILSTWDKAIATTEHLLANSQQQKQALTWQLLTGKKRFAEFSDTWGEQKLSEISTRIQKKTDGEAHPILTISSLSGFVTQEERYSRYMAGESVNNYVLLRRGEFAYNKGNSKTYQYGCIFKLDTFATGLVPHVYVCFKLNQGFDPGYYSQLFAADYLKDQLAGLVNTGVRNNGLLNIKPSAFLDTTVPVPPLAEQQKIAQVLTTADAEIANLQAQLAKLKLEKKALMQQLLTGQRRVKLDAETAA